MRPCRTGGNNHARTDDRAVEKRSLGRLKLEVDFGPATENHVQRREVEAHVRPAVRLGRSLRHVDFHGVVGADREFVALRGRGALASVEADGGFEARFVGAGVRNRDRDRLRLIRFVVDDDIGRAFAGSFRERASCAARGHEG